LTGGRARQGPDIDLAKVRPIDHIVVVDRRTKFDRALVLFCLVGNIFLKTSATSTAIAAAQGCRARQHIYV
jgi:hypothetical protein